eukprot:6939588-Pyramimonas_sp.AAC.1
MSRGGASAHQNFDAESVAAARGPGRTLAQLPPHTALPAMWGMGGTSPQSSGSFTTKFPSRPPRQKFKNSIVVVGNGASVIDTGLGSKID